jgi:hypothetical protein
MHQLEAKDCVFLDETGVNSAMTRHYGRAVRGQRVHTSAPVNKGKNVTILGALSLEGIQAIMTIAGRTDTAVFLTCVPTI